MAITNALVVDDSRLARLTLTKLLEKRQIDVDKVASAREAFETLKTTRPDVILMDVTMPDIDGLEATRMITNNPETSQIPVIMCTAEDTSEARDRALACGATAFLTKPAGDENLDRVLEEISQQLANAANEPEEVLVQAEAANESMPTATPPPAPSAPTPAEAAPPPAPAAAPPAPAPAAPPAAGPSMDELLPRIEQVAREAAQSAAENTARTAAQSAAQEFMSAQRDEIQSAVSDMTRKLARQAALDVVEENQKFAREESKGNLDTNLVRDVAENVASEIAQREAAQITADFGSAIRSEFEEQIEKLLTSDSLKKKIAATVSKPAAAKGPDPAAIQKFAAEVAERTSQNVVRELATELARSEARETTTALIQEHLRQLQPGEGAGKAGKRAKTVAGIALFAAILAMAGAGFTLYERFLGPLF